jgi:hypothetical protein
VLAVFMDKILLSLIYAGTVEAVFTS